MGEAVFNYETFVLPGIIFSAHLVLDLGVFGFACTFVTRHTLQ